MTGTMDDIHLAMLAQVAADFALRPVIYKWTDDEGPDLARPKSACRRPFQPLRMDLEGEYLDQLVGAVLKGAMDRKIEWAAAYVDDTYQVTVWRSSKPDHTVTTYSAHLHQSLLQALSKLLGGG